MDRETEKNLFKVVGLLSFTGSKALSDNALGVVEFDHFKN